MQHVTIGTSSVLVIADDFTGACDTGVQFSAQGEPCQMRFADEVPSRVRRGRVTVYDTESRNLESDEAARRIAGVLDETGRRDQVIFKKIDSTLRGNIDAELNAVLEVEPGRVAVVAPAFPSMGRTTVNGRSLVRGIELHRTDFGPVTHSRMVTSDVQAVVAGDRDVSCVGDAAALAWALAAAVDGSIIVVDAESDGDLDSIVSVCLQRIQRCVMVGSAGLAAALSRTVRGAPTMAVTDIRRELFRPGECGAALGVVGSRSEVTLNQVQRVLEADIADRVVLRVDKLELTTRDVVDRLRRDRSVVLLTGSHAEHAGSGIVPARDFRFDPSEIARALGSVAVAAVRKARPTGLFLSGGETAAAVAKAIGADGATLFGEIERGVPTMRLIGVDVDIPAVTKAGGFGGADTMIAAFRWLEEGSCLA